MKKRAAKAGIKSFVLVVLAVVMNGCTATKFVPEGESFYEGSEINFELQGSIRRIGAIEEDLQELINPKPNKKFLGMRPGVWFYYKAGEPKKPKGFRHFVRTKLGREPVLLKDVNPQRTGQMLQAELQNEGYFKSTVSSDVVTKGKESTVVYNVILHPPFRLRRIEQHLFDSLKRPKIVAAMYENRMIRRNQRYRLERLKAEQERIEEVLENQGFYFFDDRYLLFDADSTVGKRRIDLDLNFEKGMPDKAVRTYRVAKINVYPSYNISNDSLLTTADTVNVNGYTYIDNQHNFRPYIITNVINLRPDSVYRRIDEEYTLSHLMGLRAFKYVNIKFTESKVDSSELHANIYLTPLLKKSIRMQLQAVSKSNNFVGPGFEATFTNRNTFRGAELFQFRLNSAYEVQISRQQAGALNAIELGAESSLSIPRFITPFGIFRYRSAKYVPQTNFKLSYTLQQRLQYFRLISMNGSYGFLWRETTLKTHELYPVDVSFVKLGKTSPAFDALLADNPALANSFQNQFILGSRYVFTLNTQMKEDIELKYDPKARRNRKSNFYFSGTIDLSGNMLSAAQNVANVEEGQKQFFGLPYSQYVRGDVDFRYYYDLNKHSKIATRFVAGMGHAYGNSTTLPYIKQFASGGSNSVRAFPARSLGPGTYNVRNDPDVTSRTFFVDQRGDIKLESSVEYRFDIIRSFKGALFADAGNIWLRDDPHPDPQGRWTKSFDRHTFISQMAIGTGAGVRFDFNFFVLRLDLAFPVRKPFLPAGERWVFDDINFRSKEWRQQNLILNIAIGYPF